MELLSVSVGGFRNLAYTTIELGGITALVSPNNYGKSNLLDAIRFAFQFIESGNKRRNNLMRSTNCIPLSPSLSNDDFRFSIEFDDPSLGEYRFVRYGFSFSWPKDDGSGCKITGETLEINAKRSGTWTNYLRRNRGQYKKGHDTRSFRSISLDDSQLAIDVLTAVEDIEINPAIRSIFDITYAICDSLETENRFHSTPLEFGETMDDSTAMFNDVDLPRALYRLKQSDPEHYDIFQSAIYTLFPEFEHISVNSYELRPEDHERLSQALKKDDIPEENIPFHIRNDLYRLMVKSANLNQPVDISHMSTGTKRIIWLVANTIIAGANSAGCIGIEEIETSIHPRMMRELLEVLNENIGSTSLLLTSHSPFLIQYLKPEKIYLGVPSKDGVATFKRVEKSKTKDVLDSAYTRGLGFGEYLSELMSSDDDGLRALGTLLED